MDARQAIVMCVHEERSGARGGPDRGEEARNEARRMMVISERSLRRNGRKEERTSVLDIRRYEQVL